MCRDILNSCVRNTEEAEKNSRNPENASGIGSGRGLGKGVWGMIEESELAKTIREGEENKVSLNFSWTINKMTIANYHRATWISSFVHK
jgi:protein phosphatase 1 regulatory subunit 37